MASQDGPKPKLIDASKLSRALGGKPRPRTLLAQARRGWIPCLKIGKRVIRFDLEAVRAEMRRNGEPK